MWTATGQSVTYANWADGQPKLNEGVGHAIYLGSATYKMFVDKTRLENVLIVPHYICEKSTNSSANGPRNSQMKQKSCSAGSNWTCRNEVTGCYCHQTINVRSSFFSFWWYLHWLISSNWQRNWADASALCKSIGMSLVSIETAAEQLLVTSGLPKFTGNSHKNSLHSLVLTGHPIPSNISRDEMVDFRIRSQGRPVDLDGYWARPELHRLGQW